MDKNKNEFTYLLYLLKCVIKNEKPDEKPDNLSFEKIFKLSHYHKVSNMAFYGIEKLDNKPDADLYKKWSQQRDIAILRDITQNTEYESFKKTFTENGVRILPLKGILIKSLYPQSDYRHMADIDVLIDNENGKKAEELMKSIGYYCEKKDVGIHDVYFKKPIMNVEIHRRLFSDNNKKIAGSFSSPWEIATEKEPFYYEFSPTDFFAFVLIHVAKHYELGGTGLRSFMDIWLYREKFENEIDYNRLDTMLQNKQLRELCHDFISLSDVWFNDKPTSEKHEHMTAYVCGSGAYGTQHNQNKNKVYNTTKSAFLKELFFPSMEHLSKIYPQVKNHHFLYPIFWLVRLVTKPFTNRKANKAKLDALLKEKKY